MLKNLSKRILQKLSVKGNSPKDEDVGLVKVDADKLGEGAKEELSDIASKLSGIPLYKGRVKHGYSLNNVSTEKKCPKCKAPTKQYYANWIYATDIAPRVMLAPAGYFCTKCPSVIVDED